MFSLLLAAVTSVSPGWSPPTLAHPFSSLDSTWPSLPGVLKGSAWGPLILLKGSLLRALFTASDTHFQFSHLSDAGETQVCFSSCSCRCSILNLIKTLQVTLFLGERSKVFLMACKPLQLLAPGFLFSSFEASLPSVSCAPAPVTLFQSLKHTKAPPTTGPLHLWFLLTGMLRCSFFTSLKSGSVARP